MEKETVFCKTDHDATFMRMEEDAMGNGQLKPAFNLQHGVDAEYITWLKIGPQPTDTTTLIPFLKEAEENLKFKYKKSAGSQKFYEATAGRTGTDSVRGRYPVSNEPEYLGIGRCLVKCTLFYLILKKLI